MDLKACLSQHGPFSEAALAEVAAVFKTRNLAKGAYLVQAHQPARELAFIETGFLRLFAINPEGKEVTVWIGGPGQFITSLSRFIFQEPNPWNIQAVTPSQLQVLSREAHLRLLEHSSTWLALDNHLLARAYTVLEQQMYAHLYADAEARYQKLMDTAPELFNHVPLLHIASMLGMAPETLSRLRSKTRETGS